MKKVFSNKYFLVILFIVLALFNAVLFLLVNSFNKDLLSVSSFWSLYGFITLLFIIIGILTFVNNNKFKEQNLFVMLVFPLSIIGILVGFVLFFFVQHIHLVLIIVPYLILIALILIGFVLSVYYHKSTNHIKIKTVEIISMSGFQNYLKELIDYNSNPVIDEVLNKLLDKSYIDVKDINNLELKSVEKRIFEYALFIKKDIEEDSVNNFLFNAIKMEELLNKRGSY